jgi:hypothetical protein
MMGTKYQEPCRIRKEGLCVLNVQVDSNHAQKKKQPINKAHEKRSPTRKGATN